MSKSAPFVIAWLVLIVGLLTHPSAARHAVAAETKMTVLFGTYARDLQQGIYAATWDCEKGTLSPLVQAARLPDPGFLAIAPGGQRLYAVGRGEPGTPLAAGRIAALSIDPQSDKLELLNELPTEGQGPCHVAVHPSGRFAAVANYGSGSVEVFAIDAQGQLERQTAFVQHAGSSIDPERQTGPHAHSINFDPAGRFALAADLGLDQILVYRFDDRDGSLTPAQRPSAPVPRGHGPRHLAFAPNGKFAYVINEMGGTVTTFQYDPAVGGLTPIETVDALPDGFSEARRGAEILVHPNGRTLYCSHRGHDSVAALSIDPASGRLKLIGTAPTSGGWPRSFAIDPTGRWIIAANQNGGNAAVLRIDEATGRVAATGTTVFAPEAVCVRFLVRDQ